jgi:hypothetical protein
MEETKFDKLVKNGIIVTPESFSEDDKKQINGLDDAEVKALISVRSKLGDAFLKPKATGPAPSIAIVF